MRENFNQSYIRLSYGDGIFSKPNCLVVILYFLILYSARLAKPIFKINFAISTFGNFLRDVQLKWFHFKHGSHTTELLLMAIIFWQTKQNHFENFYSCRKFCPCRIFYLQNIFRFDKSLQIFHPLRGSDMVLRSDFKCSFVTSTPFSAFFTVDVETTHSWSFSKMEDLQLPTLHLSILLFSKTRKSMNTYGPISASKKEHLFSRIFQVTVSSL